MLWVKFLNDDLPTSFFILFSSFWLFFFCITTSLVEVGAWDVHGLPPLAQSAPRQSYAPKAGKPALLPWVPTPMEPGACHTDLSVEE